MNSTIFCTALLASAFSHSPSTVLPPVVLPGEVDQLTSLGGGRADFVYDVAVYNSGSSPSLDRIYVVGEFSESFEYLPGSCLTSEGETDAFLVALDGNGTVQWANRIGGPFADRALRVSVSGSKIRVEGSFFAECSFDHQGSHVISSLTSTVAKRYFIEFDLNGVYDDLVHSHGVENIFAFGLPRRTVTVDPGGTESTFVFDAMWGARDVEGSLQTSAGRDDVLVFQTSNSTGNLEFVSTVGGPGKDWPTSGAYYQPSGSSSHYVVLVGNYEETATFGAGLSATSVGGTDVFVARYLVRN